jgi:hypothetical protein
MQIGGRSCAERERLAYELEVALDKYLTAAKGSIASPRSIGSDKTYTALQEARVRLRDHYQHCQQCGRNR